MAKFLLGIAIVVFTSFCGYMLAKKYRQKKHFFIQFTLFNERFISELSYFRRPIREFVLAYSYKGEFAKCLERFLFLNSKESLVFQEELNSSEYYFLKNDEKSTVYNYFSMLGKGDSASQKTYFSNVRDILKKHENEACIECKKYGDLYIKMGFLLGLLILILIL